MNAKIIRWVNNAWDIRWIQSINHRIGSYLNEINFRDINFRMDLFSRRPKPKFFADGQISVISRGLIFAVDKICIWKNFSFLIISRHENSIYFSSVSTTNITFNFTKSLLLLTIYYHYFHCLNVQKCWKFYWARK